MVNVKFPLTGVGYYDMEPGGRSISTDEIPINIQYNKMKDQINSTNNKDALSMPPLVQPICGITSANKVYTDQNE